MFLTLSIVITCLVSLGFSNCSMARAFDPRRMCMLCTSLLYRFALFSGSVHSISLGSSAINLFSIQCGRFSITVSNFLTFFNAPVRSASFASATLKTFVAL
ncbi:hypothetical protein BJ546DRAFT_635342 [Cryomyces antarcticus]